MSTFNRQLFSERFKEMRIKAGYRRQIDLAEKLGTVVQTISNYESGNRLPDAEMLARIVEVFPCNADYLLGFEDKPTYSTAYISDQTGLTNDAIAVLRKMALDSECAKSGGTPVADYLSKFITGDQVGYLVKLALGIQVFEVQEKSEKYRKKQGVQDEDSSILATIFNVMHDDSRPISKFDLFSTAAKHLSMEIYGEFFDSLVPREETETIFSK